MIIHPNMVFCEDDVNGGECPECPDPGATVSTLTYDSFDARFFSELGLPDAQGWTYSGNVTLQPDNIFGVEKDSIYFANGSAQRPVTAAEWAHTLVNGASYSFIMRFEADTQDNQVFCGLGFSAANDPRPSSSPSRFTIRIDIADFPALPEPQIQYMNITPSSTSNYITLNGSNGAPSVQKNTWFMCEAVILPTPDGGLNFGDMELYVNGVLLDVESIEADSGAASDIITILRWSGTGSSNFYIDNFGVTGYKEPPSKLLTATDMTNDSIAIITPGGNRHYEAIIPDGSPRPIGAKFEVLAKNVHGNITLRSENLASPQTLFNGVNSYVIEVPEVKKVNFVNTIDQGNVYQAPMAERNLSRLNFYTPLANTYTTPLLVADTPTEVFLGEQAIVKTAKDFSIDTVEQRWYLSDPTAVNRWFIIHVSNSISISVPNQNVAIEVYKNGVFVEGVGASRRMATGSDLGNLNLVGVTQMSFGDYIQGYVTLSAAGTITFERFALTINEIVGAE